MRPGNILSGAAFKTAALSLGVFIVVLAVAGGAIVGIVRSAMIHELEEQVAEELIVFREVYRSQGPRGVARLADRLAAGHVSATGLVGLFGDGGTPVAGELKVAPEFIGWGTFHRPIALPGRASDYHVNAVRVGSQTVVVGRSLAAVNAVTGTLLRALLLAGLAVTVVSLASGFLLSRDVYRKLNAMAETLDAVSRGNLGARLPVSALNDQVDRVARRMNTHLDRLARLTEATRNTVVAVAHDLRTPLNRASLMVHSAAQAGDAPARDEALGAAERELAHIAETFDTILRIARIETAPDAATLEPQDLRAIVAEIAESYGAVVEDSDRVLTVQPGEAPAMVRADRRMLLQALGNLLENAVRHTPPGTAVSVTLQTGASVTLTVADNGPGIPENAREDALRPFHRLDPSAGREGTGLGLALVRAVAERHGAALVLGDNGPGLSVTLSFPPANLTDL